MGIPSGVCGVCVCVCVSPYLPAGIPAWDLTTKCCGSRRLVPSLSGPQFICV